jgi:hypothetical protein
MKEVLKDMLQDTLIVPYDDSVIEELTQVCQDYASKDNLSDEDFEDLVFALLTNKQNSSLCKILEKNYKSKTNDEIKLPKCIWMALTVFILFTAIHDLESNDETKALYSATLMNYMILRKGTFNTVPFKKYLIQLYGHFDNYWTTRGEINKSDDSGLLNRILTNPDFIEDEGISNDQQSELQSIANDAAKFRINQLMQSSELMTIKNPFIRTYHGLMIFSTKLPWLYLNYTIKDLLATLLPQQNYNTKKLREILVDIHNTENYIAPEFMSKSSILLRLLGYDSELEDVLIFDEEFSPKDFCVYLYYELMLEKKLKDYNDGEGE